MDSLKQAKKSLRQPSEIPKRLLFAAASLMAAALLLTLGAYHFGFDTLNTISNQLLPAELWGAITLFGDALVYIGFAAAVSHYWPQYIWLFFLGGIPQAITVNSIKHATEIDRPLAVLASSDFHHYGPPHDWGSFPSGHTATAALGCGLIFAISRNQWVKGFAISLIILVALSRVALGVHWPVDVLAGAAIGLSNAALAIWLAKRWTGGLNPIPYTLLALLMAAGCWQLFGHDGGYPWAGYLSPAIALSGFLGLIILVKKIKTS